MFITTKYWQIVFQSGYIDLQLLSTIDESSSCYTSSPTLDIVILASLMGIEWHHILVLICSLLDDQIKLRSFSQVYGLPRYPLLWNVYSSHLPMFPLGYLTFSYWFASTLYVLWICKTFIYVSVYIYVCVLNTWQIYSHLLV